MYCIANRTLISINGADRAAFLQGLITQDIYTVTAYTPKYSLMLTPQGRFLYDFFLFEKEDAYILDCDTLISEALFKRLRMYKLRSAVDITLMNNIQVILSKIALNKEFYGFQDPRLKQLGWRYYLFPENYQPLPVPTVSWDFHFHTMALGIPDGVYDLNEKSIPLECNMEELQAISFNKGCYLGQELTARTKHTGVVRKRLMPGCLLSFSAAITNADDIYADDKIIGKVQSIYKNLFLARVSIDKLTNAWMSYKKFYCKDNEIKLWKAIG